MVSVHPVLGNLGREPGAQAVVGVRHRVLVRLELAQLAVAGLEHRVGALLLLPGGVERLLVCCALAGQRPEPLRHLPFVLVPLQCEVFLGIDGQQRVLRGGRGEHRDIPDPRAVLHQAGQVCVQLSGALGVENWHLKAILDVLFYLGEILGIF